MVYNKMFSFDFCIHLQHLRAFYFFSCKIHTSILGKNILLYYGNHKRGGKKAEVEEERNKKKIAAAVATRTQRDANVV